MKNGKFTEQDKKDMYFLMGTAKMECELALNLTPNEVNIFQQKNKKGEIIEGLYYLVGSSRNKKGFPTKIHFKKDFRQQTNK